MPNVVIALNCAVLKDDIRFVVNTFKAAIDRVFNNDIAVVDTAANCLVVNTSIKPNPKSLEKYPHTSGEKFAIADVDIATD